MEGSRIRRPRPAGAPAVIRIEPDRERSAEPSRTSSEASLRVALVCSPLLPVPPERYAGTERIVATLVDGLLARGHRVTLFGAGDSTVDCEVVPVTERALWPQGFRGNDTMYREMSVSRAWEQQARFDVVHSHVEDAGFAFARHALVPVVSTMHSRLDGEGMRELIDAYPDVALVSISRNQRRWHPAANWVATIHHGLPLEEMPFSPTPGSYLALVGRVSPEKGIAEAIQLAQLSGLPLRIAAKALDPAEVELFETVVRPALGDHISYLGEVGPDERDPLFVGALATVMLGGWPEPFGLVAIESLATGTPVIARRAGALPEIVEHGVDGFLIDDMAEARLAVHLAGRLDRRAIRQRALARFGADRMVDAYVALYRSLIASRDTAQLEGSAPAGLRTPARPR